MNNQMIDRRKSSIVQWIMIISLIIQSVVFVGGGIKIMIQLEDDRVTMKEDMEYLKEKVNNLENRMERLESSRR